MFEDRDNELNTEPSIEKDANEETVVETLVETEQEATTDSPADDSAEAVVEASEPLDVDADAPAPDDGVDAVEGSPADEPVDGADETESDEAPKAEAEPKPVKQQILPIPSEEDLEELGYTEEEYIQMFEMYDSTLRSIDEGELVKGTVLSITNSEVTVDIGFKSEGRIPLDEFRDPSSISVGDEVSVLLEATEDRDGEVKVSKRKADFLEVWDKIKVIRCASPARDAL